MKTSEGSLEQPSKVAFCQLLQERQAHLSHAFRYTAHHHQVLGQNDWVRHLDFFFGTPKM